jgi:hypothetical protein
MCKREYLQLIDQGIVSLGKYDVCFLIKIEECCGYDGVAIH